MRYAHENDSPVKYRNDPESDQLPSDAVGIGSIPAQFWHMITGNEPYSDTTGVASEKLLPSNL